MFYLDILETLHNNKIRYVVIGGLAVNLHGIPRTTADIDIIISLDRDNVLKLVNALRELGYIPRLPVDPEGMADPETRRIWIQEKNMKAFSFYNKKENFRAIDIVLVHPLSFDQVEKRSIRLKVRGLRVPVASIDDLIEMKRASDRDQDRSDVEMLEEAKRIGREG